MSANRSDSAPVHMFHLTKSVNIRIESTAVSQTLNSSAALPKFSSNKL